MKRNQEGKQLRTEGELVARAENEKEARQRDGNLDLSETRYETHEEGIERLPGSEAKPLPIRQKYHKKMHPSPSELCHRALRKVNCIAYVYRFL